MDSILKDLKRCELNNGKLTVPNISEEGLIRLSNELRRMLLSYKIPHYKVIGANIVVKSGRQLVDFVTKTRGINKSYAELISVLRDFIISEVAGRPSALMWSDADTLINFLSKREFAFVTSDGNNVNTENGSLIFECSAGKQIRNLIKNVELIKFQGDSSRIDILFYRGTGILDFPEATSIITRMQGRISNMTEKQPPQYVPLSQAYDLTQIFTVKLLRPGDTNIQLCYKRNINEEILKQILVGWAEDIEQEELKQQEAEVLALQQEQEENN